MEQPPALIEINDLRKKYRTSWRRGYIEALAGVTFEVRRGEIFGLLGPNGAGKTTIIKILLGIVRCSGGEATLLGFPAGDRRGRKRVGYLPENLRLAPHQTARTALEYYGRLSGLTQDRIRRRADDLLPMVGLHGRDRESVARFSKGMRQRLGLAQALLHDPEVLILDEPTDGLDPVGRAQVRTVLQDLRDQGRTIFLNSHLLQEVERICDRIAILDRGSLGFVGSIDDLTPPEQNDLQLEVLGEEPRIRQALSQHQLTSARSVGKDRFLVVVPVKDQSGADAIMDALRASKVSIASMSWKRKSLEDAFLEVVAQTAEIV